MQYRMITLELLYQHSLPQTMQLLDRYSGDLRDSHLAWTEALSRQRPGSDPGQLSSEAMEMAIRDLQEQLSQAQNVTPSPEAPTT